MSNEEQQAREASMSSLAIVLILTGLYATWW